MLVQSHGGGCCGISHIHNMDNSSEEELLRLLSEISPVPGNPNRLTEIVLSSRQVGIGGMQASNPLGGWPAILNRAGFRLVSRFRNSNSGNECYVFHHVPEFLSLAPETLPGQLRLWDTNYIPADVGGAGVNRRQDLLPEPTEAFPIGSRVSYRRGGARNVGTQGEVVGYVNGTNRALRILWDNATYSGDAGTHRANVVLIRLPVPVGPLEFIVGARVRRLNQLVGPSVPAGSLGTVLGGDIDQGNVRVQWDNGHNTGTYGRTTIELVQQEAIPNAPVPAPVEVEAVAVFTTFHNFIQRNGRVGREYPTLAEAQAAAPRCRRQDRRDIMNNGDIIWTDSVN